MDNYFLNDASDNFRRTAHIMRRRRPTRDDTMDAVLYFSFGAERYMKAMLWNINPMLVLKVEKVEKCIPLLYAETLLETPKAEDDGQHINTLGYMEALDRASRFYQFIVDRRGLLTELGSIRNNIAHDSLAKIDHDKAHRFVHALFYPTALEFANHFRLDPVATYGQEFEALQTDSTRLNMIVHIRSQVEERLAQHRLIWQKHHTDETYVAKSKANMRASLEDGHDYDENVYIAITCPACGQQAVMTTLEESDSPDITGFTITKLYCEFCKFAVSDQLEMDCLQLYNKAKARGTTIRPFGHWISDD